MVDSDQVSRHTAATIPWNGQNGPRYIFSIDYGTTYTGVAWVLTSGNPNKPSTLKDINIVEQWAGQLQPKVPSKITYSVIQGSMERWGYNLGGDVYVLEKTKLDLQEPDRSKALTALRRTLEATQYMTIDVHANALSHSVPRHFTKTSPQIVTDYLFHVARSVRDAIVSDPDGHALGQFPIDLIFTHPAEWDKRAKNLTFRAVTAAFGKTFHEAAQTNGKVYMASESEACAQYTMHDTEDGAIKNLVEGDCFIVVDAGGGTVDLATYKVEQLVPFRVTLATKISGGKCGATYIDEYFLNEFLPSRLTDQDMHYLRSVGGRDEHYGGAAHSSLRRGEEHLLSQFMVLKHNFKGLMDNGEEPEPNWINLPRGVGTVNDAKMIRPGCQLGITYHDMRTMFHNSLLQTKNLIKGQVMQLDAKRLTAQAVFLSGGFSRNEYVFKELEAHAHGLNLEAFRGTDSWTAVAKGAALMAMGIGCGELPQSNVGCPWHLGVVLSSAYTSFDHDPGQKYIDTFDGISRAKDHIHWVVTKHDLISYEDGILERLKVIRKLGLDGHKKGQIIVVTSTSIDSLGPPSKLKIDNDGSRVFYKLDYDLSNFSPEQLKRHPAAYRHVRSESGTRYDQVEMEIEIRITQQDRAANIRLIWGRTVGYYGASGEPGHELSKAVIPF